MPPQSEYVAAGDGFSSRYRETYRMMKPPNDTAVAECVDGKPAHVRNATTCY
jgi:hypothetical protein